VLGVSAGFFLFFYECTKKIPVFTGYISNVSNRDKYSLPKRNGQNYAFFLFVSSANLKYPSGLLTD
jgi:hypothetical protein